VLFWVGVVVGLAALTYWAWHCEIDKP
jgi:hypothetical protein